MMGKSALAYLPVNLANILASFGTIMILTRLLTGAEFGVYALAVITIQFVHMGSFTWIEAAIARFLPRTEIEGNSNCFLKTLYLTAIALGFVMLMLILGTLYLLPISDNFKIILAFALSSTCLQVLFNMCIETHKASYRIRRYSLIYTTHTLLAFSLGILLIIGTPLRAEAPFIGVILANILILFIELPFMWKYMKGGQFTPYKVKNAFVYGMPICISLLLSYTLSSADMYLISGFMGAESAGQYNAGYNLANRSVDILFIWLGMAITPMIITAQEHDGLEKSRQMMSDYAGALLWVTLPAATGIALVSEPAGIILGEPVRAGAVKIMPWIAFTGVLNGMISYYAQRAFMLSEKTGMFVWALVPPVIINLTLNFMWIPKYGLIGAVYATLIAYGLGLILTLAIGRRYYPLPMPFKTLGKIIFACVLMALAVRAIPLSPAMPDILELIIKAVIGGIVYGALSLLLNIADCRTLIGDIFQKFSKSQNEAVEAANPTPTQIVEASE